MGTNERKTRTQQIRREDIIDAAERVFFAKGFASATMDDVSREAEYSKRTLYAYFTSKEQLYNAIILRAYQILNTLIHENLSRSQSQNSLEKLATTLRAFIHAITQFPDYFRAIIDYQNRDEDFDTEDAVINACYEAGNVSTEIILALLKEGVSDGSLKADLEINSAYLFIYGSLIGIGTLNLNKAKYIADYFQQPIFRLTDASIDLILDALRAQEPSNIKKN